MYLNTAISRNASENVNNTRAVQTQVDTEISIIYARTSAVSRQVSVEAFCFPGSFPANFPEYCICYQLFFQVIRGFFYNFFICMFPMFSVTFTVFEDFQISQAFPCMGYPVFCRIFPPLCFLLKRFPKCSHHFLGEGGGIHVFSHFESFRCIITLLYYIFFCNVLNASPHSLIMFTLGESGLKDNMECEQRIDAGSIVYRRRIECKSGKTMLF